MRDLRFPRSKLKEEIKSRINKVQIDSQLLKSKNQENRQVRVMGSSFLIKTKMESKRTVTTIKIVKMDKVKTITGKEIMI